MVRRSSRKIASSTATSFDTSACSYLLNAAVTSATTSGRSISIPYAPSCLPSSARPRESGVLGEKSLDSACAGMSGERPVSVEAALVFRPWNHGDAGTFERVRDAERHVLAPRRGNDLHADRQRFERDRHRRD